MFDKEYYYQLVERHKDMLWHVCSDYGLSGAWEVEDAFQEVLCALWEELPSLRDRACEKAWVYKVATHTMLMICRKRQNRPTEPLPTDMEKRGSEGVPPLQSDYGYLMQLIALLPETDCHIVRAHIDGYKFKEIGKELGMSEEVVSKRYHRDIKKIRQLYEKEP